MPDNNTQLTQDALKFFITLPEEELLLVERKHWLLLIFSLLSALMFFFFSIVASVFVFGYIFPQWNMVIVSLLLWTTCFLSLSIKMIIDWYFHIYIITNRKILEVHYTPLFSHEFNQVLLDQVRCTEVDIQTHGIVRELFDMGDIVLTFDRPTHEESFIFSNIKNPRQVAHILGNYLNINTQNNNTLWYKPKNKNNIFRFTEDIFPRRILGAG